MGKVIGTLDDTVHAVNMLEKLEQVPNKSFILAIDANMGNSTEVGNLVFYEPPLDARGGF